MHIGYSDVFVKYANTIEEYERYTLYAKLKTLQSVKCYKPATNLCHLLIG